MLDHVFAATRKNSLMAVARGLHSRRSPSLLEYHRHAITRAKRELRFEFHSMAADNLHSPTLRQDRDHQHGLGPGKTFADQRSL